MTLDNTAKEITDGIYDSLGTLVSPASLYRAQLEQRLGAAALAKIGYNDFGLAVTPAAQQVDAGGSADFAVNVKPINGFDENVGLWVFGLPFGVKAQLASHTIEGGSGPTTLAVTTDRKTRGGNLYPVH